MKESLVKFYAHPERSFLPPRTFDCFASTGNCRLNRLHTIVTTHEPFLEDLQVSDDPLPILTHLLFHHGYESS